MVGDQLLITIARRLENCVRAGDTVARLGGDEFTILVDNIKTIKEAIIIAEKIQARLLMPIKLEGHEIVSGSSIGIVLGASGYRKAEDILRDADTAMYRAKSEGRSRYTLFDGGMHTQTLARLQLENDLRQAIDRQEFLVYYQPIISLFTNQITGIEALIRWQHPQQGLLDPSHFIELAEETGLIVPIGEWLLRTACTQVKKWHVNGFPQLRLAVNISLRQFQQYNLLTLITMVLEKTQFPAESLELEITEDIAAKNNDYNETMLQKLRMMGISLSIDDFGTGYSSLNRLRRLPINTLKIDRVFLQDIGTQSNNTAIVSTIINMAHQLKLKVIAEGVETKQQLAFLQSQNCDEIQGFLFSHPLPPDLLTHLLQTKDATLSLKMSILTEELHVLMLTQAGRKVGYALADEDLIVFASNERMNRWADRRPNNLVGQSLLDVFPELIGLEDVLHQLTRCQGEAFTIPKIYRSPLTEDTVLSSDPIFNNFGRYFDLQVEPFCHDGTGLLILATDVTYEAHREFDVRQERNQLQLTIINRDKSKPDD